MQRNTTHDEKKSQILTYLQYNEDLHKVMVDYSMNPMIYKNEMHTHEDVFNKLIEDVINAMDEEGVRCEKAVGDLIKRIQSSQRCHDDLISAGLVSAAQKWEYKRAGWMTGCVLYRTSEPGQILKTYIKSYSDTNIDVRICAEAAAILYDYTVFTVANRCGVRAPVVNIRESADKVYLFSDDIAAYQEKRPGKKYQFFELDKSHEQQLLNMTSLHRFLVLCFIFRLEDLHAGNMGYVISHRDEKVKTKIGLIDFEIDRARILENLDIKDIYEESKYFLNNLFPDLNLMRDATLEDFEIEFRKAFKKFEVNFLSACDEALTNTDGLTAVTRYEIEEFQRNFEIWVSNYEALMNLVNKVNLCDNLESSLCIKKT